MSEFNYFKKPQFIFIRDDGVIGLEYIREDNSRFLIYWEPSEKEDDPAQLYTVEVTDDKSETKILAYNHELVLLLKNFGVELAYD